MKVGKSTELRSRSMRRNHTVNPHHAIWRPPATYLACACGIMLAVGGGVARAVGLGSIELASGLNERLDASIPVHDLEGHPPDTVAVELASPRHFRAVGIQYRPEYSRFRFELERSAAGGYRVRVQSPQPIVEPFVSFVLELRLPTGRLLREYTVLLDPPSAATESLASQDSADSSPEGARESVTGDDTGLSATGNGGPADVATTGENDTATRSLDDSGVDRYGPVRPGSSAWQVAAAIRQPGTSIHQRMIALLRANPDAFRDNDLGELKAGVWLDIPAAETVASISRERAAALYKQHVDPSDNTETQVADSSYEGGEEPRPFGLWTAHASTSDGAGTSTPAAFDANEGEGAASGPPQAVVFRDASPWTFSLDDPFEPDVTAATLVARIEQEFENSLASREARFAELREGLDTMQEDLATVREELALLRTRQQTQPAAAAGISGWMAGLVALLVFAIGAIGGFWGGRRLTMQRLADGVTHGSATLADRRNANPAPSHDSAADSRWAAIDAERDTGSGTLAEMDEHAVNNSARAAEDRYAGSTPDEADAPEPEADSHAVQQALPMTDAPLLGRVDDSRVSGGRKSGSSREETAEILFQEADTDQVSDFYHSLAKLYLASGWPSDAEALLRSTIEQKGDKAIYRVRILEALYQLGHRDQFLRDFEAYQAIADANDPSWTWVQTMGRILWPDNPAFAEHSDGAADNNAAGGYYDLEQVSSDVLGGEENEITFDLADEGIEDDAIENEDLEDIEDMEDGWLDGEVIGDEWIEGDSEFSEDNVPGGDDLSLDLPESEEQDFPVLKSVDDPSLSDMPDAAVSGSSGSDPSGEEDDERPDEQWSVGGVNSGQSR